MSGISTHVLDTTVGRPAGGVQVLLERRGSGAQAGEWYLLEQGVTDADGRCRPLLAAAFVTAGVHRLTFGTGPYFAGRGQTTLYPEVTVTFEVDCDGASFHIPLLLNAFGYTTYRGS